MTNIISKTSFLVAISLVALFAATAANAETTARFEIPFQFIMGDKVLPAGDYVVKIDHATRRIDVTSNKASARLFLTANAPRRTDGTVDMGKLIFHQYGKVYVLRQMWRFGSSWGYELPASKVESEMAKRQGADATREIAAVGAWSK